jgi:hypothetical protein
MSSACRRRHVDGSERQGVIGWQGANRLMVVSESRLIGSVSVTIGRLPACSCRPSGPDQQV